MNLRALRNLRPLRPTKFLGVALTDRAFLVAEVGVAAAGPEIRRCAEFRFPKDLTLENLPAIGRPFAQFLRQNDFTARHIVIGLPMNWLLVKTKEIPPTTDALAADMLRLQSETEFSSELSELVYDYAGQSDRQNARSVLIMAVPRQRLDQITEMAQAARLSIRAIMPSMVALGTVSRSLVGNRGIVAYVGAGVMELAVQKGAALQRLTHVAIGTAAHIAAAGGASAGMDTPVREVAAELKRTLASLPQNGSAAPPKLVFWDNGELGASARQLIGELLGLTLDAQPLSALGTISASPEAARCVPAIALGLAAVNPAGPAIDFAHSRLAPPRATTLRRKIIWASSAGALALLIVAGAAVDTHLQASELQRLQKQLSEESPQIAQAKAFESRFTFAKGWYGADPKFINALGYLTQAFPDDGSAWAVNIEVRNDPKPAPAPPAEPHPAPVVMVDNLKVQITGKAVNWNTAQLIEDRLRSGGKFKNVSLLDQRGAGRSSTEVSFSISFEFPGSELPHGRH